MHKSPVIAESGVNLWVARLTDYACPVCGKPMAENTNHREGPAKARRFLKCSNPLSGRDISHKDVVYFRDKGGQWWSPKLGKLEVKSG